MQGNSADSKFSEDKASIVLVTIPKGYAFVLNQEIESKAEQAFTIVWHVRFSFRKRKLSVEKS